VVTFVKISTNEKIKFETNRFWCVRLNLWDDQKSSLNMFVMTNWKKLKINIKDSTSANDIVLCKCNI
jgi:hypothetical protein